MDRAGERVRVEEITTVSYGEGRETLLPWPLSWSGVWVGTLSAIALALVFGLVAIALGAHQVGQPFGTWREVSFLALALSVFGSLPAVSFLRKCSTISSMSSFLSRSAGRRIWMTLSR